MAAPMALSALAAVAQGTIAGYAQEAAQKAILQADLERIHMSLERACMQGEDNRQKYVNSTKRTDALQSRLDYQTICIRDLYETIEDLEGVERDNGQYIDHLRDKKRKLKQKYRKLVQRHRRK